ncbi:hypothetical protein FGO68_gene3088 [Halteria grandinella]|uniref:Uncharacterized protein n=1 Tax=Halteria grandinella TaxID=5974 RepID=A0A8J8SWT9_HALGN|nr:hypothetical protein FGO68_gene3088 [Halteria grandinella]
MPQYMLIECNCRLAPNEIQRMIIYISLLDSNATPINKEKQQKLCGKYKRNIHSLSQCLTLKIITRESYSIDFARTSDKDQQELTDSQKLVKHQKQKLSQQN